LKRLLPVVIPALLTLAATFPASAQQATLSIDLGATGNAERTVTRYECEDGIERVVTYINAAPNFLALFPHEDKTLVMANVLSASGARYAAGQFIWWTSGPDADLYDVTAGEDAAPIAHCFEITETP
jgi:membrane-bound inhibitor of C-type lysozyme